MKTVAIIQARMNSSRLPGKILFPIMGKPMLQIQVERLLGSQMIDDVIVATSTEISDNPVEDLCLKNHFSYYRGSLNDVLTRIYNAAHGADTIIRITGDCPLVHYEYIDRMLTLFKTWEVDYLSNGRRELSRTPDGFDVEIMTHDVLEKLFVFSSEREHPTKDLWLRPDMYGNCTHLPMLSVLYDRKYSVDTMDDFLRVKNLFEFMRCTDFSVDELLYTKGAGFYA